MVVHLPSCKGDTKVRWSITSSLALSSVGASGGPRGATTSGSAGCLGAEGYAGDTQAVVPGMAALQSTIPTTEHCLHLAAQVVNVAKFTTFLEESADSTALILWHAPMLRKA